MSRGDWFIPIFLLAMARRELAGGRSIWFLFLAVFEGGQRGEVFSKEGDEQWLLKGSQGPDSGLVWVFDNWVARLRLEMGY